MNTNILTMTRLADDLDTAAKAFLNYSKSKNLSGRTLEYYTERLEAFRRYVDEYAPEISPRDVSPALIRDFLGYTITRTSAATANHNRAVLFRLFAFLIRDGFLDTNPVESVEKMREPRKVIATFNPEQVAEVLNTCDAKSFLGTRDKALLLTLYDTGIRVSEAIGLKMEDVLWAEQLLRIMGKGSIGRLVPFGLAVRRALTSYLARRGEIEGQPLLFVTQYGEKIDRNTVRWMFIRRARKARISGPRVSPHTLRHSFAVQYLRNGGDAFSLQKILGHSSMEMVRRYVNLCQADIQEIHRRFSPADAMQVSQKHGTKRIR